MPKLFRAGCYSVDRDTNFFIVNIVICLVIGLWNRAGMTAGVGGIGIGGRRWRGDVWEDRGDRGSCHIRKFFPSMDDRFHNGMQHERDNHSCYPPWLFP